jgi:hypothetical protein
MRIFEGEGRINYVDINDVYVGFDDFQSCCESFGHYFTATPDPEGETLEQPANLADLVFDPEFFETTGDDDGGGHAVFRLVAPHLARIRNDRASREAEREIQRWGGVSEVYLVIFNHHNGYYSHGFDFSVGGKVVQSGAL